MSVSVSVRLCVLSVNVFYDIISSAHVYIYVCMYCVFMHVLCVFVSLCEHCL